MLYLPICAELDCRSIAMTFKILEPGYNTSKKSSSNFRLALRTTLAALGVLWVILIIDSTFGLGLVRFGLRPQSAVGLVGLVTAPLLHANAQHLLSNSMPFVVSLTAMLFLYPNSSVRTIPLMWLGSGLLSWIIGRPTVHIGVSGLVYGMLAFVFIGGVLRRDMRSVSVTLLVGFLYGSMIWGVLPIRPFMSWEMHLSGAIMGGALAILYRSWDRVPIKRYEWEDDDSVPDWFPRDAEEDSESTARKLPDRDRNVDE